MICEVLVKRAVSGAKSFDYETNEDIHPFTLVKVPLGSQTIQGIVIGVKEKSPYSTKKVTAVLSKGPIISKLQYMLAEKTAEYFLGSLSDTLNRFIPSLNVKDLKKIGADITVKKAKAKKSVFISGERIARIEHFCQLADNKQNLIILPTLKSINDTEKFVKRILPTARVYIFHSLLKSSQKAEIYQSILEGKSCIIISTRHGLFLPFSKLSNIYIDEPFNYAYQEDQSPYYNALIVTKILSELSGARLIVGDSCPDLINYMAIIKKRMDFVELKNELDFVVYNNPRKINQNRFFIDAISRDLKQKKSVCFVGNFKDTAKMRCGTCKKEIICQNCKTGNFDSGSNQCASCSSKIVKCLYCDSPNIFTMGSTYSDMIHIIKEMLGEFSDSIETRAASFSKKQILVTTFREVSSVESTIDTFIIVDFDYLSSSPLFSGRLNLFRKILDFCSHGGKKVIIFSDQENEYLNDIISKNWRRFLSRELRERKVAKLPPFSTPLEISCSARTDTAAQKKLKDFASELKSKILYISLPTEKKEGGFIGKSVLFLPHDFRQANKWLASSTNIKIKVWPADYF